MQSILLSIVFASAGFFIPSAHAFLPNAKMPVCLDGPDEMRVDNERVLKLKHTTKNQYLDRAYVQGSVIEAPSVQNGHDHFAISIGPGPKDTIEVIYNKDFGSMPAVRPGDDITVCGDYITATASSGGYKPSPEGAIIHWVHFNPGTRQGSARHEHGFVMIAGNLIGFDEAPLGAWDGRIVPAPQPNGNPSNNTQNTRNVESRPNRNNDQRPSSRPSDNRGQGNRGRPNPGRWKPCRSIEECSARNH